MRVILSKFGTPANWEFTGRIKYCKSDLTGNVHIEYEIHYWRTKFPASIFECIKQGISGKSWKLFFIPQEYIVEFIPERYFDICPGYQETIYNCQEN